MNNLLGIGVALFGAYLSYHNVTTTDDVTLAMWGKALLALVAGTGIVGYNSFGFIKGKIAEFKSGKLGENLVKNVNLVQGEPVAGISIKTEEEKDMEAIFYLTERCKKEGNGLELCRQINDLFFSIHHPKEEVKNV